jgi:hypothetical protein
VRPRIFRAAGAALPLALLAVGSLAEAAGAADSSSRARILAALPDWTGIWETEAAAAMMTGKPPATPQLWDRPPYTPQAQQKYAPSGFPLAGAENLIPALESASPTVKACQPFGFPAVMEVPVPDYLFELLVTPEQTLLLSTDGTVRHIYTDGRPHPRPEDLWPTPAGDSIGHWEGTTLVIDTIAREPGPVVPGTPGVANLSGQAHFTERLRRIDADTLEDAMTIEDPSRFTRPWQVTIRYLRAKDLDRMIPAGSCEHDRNPVIGGKTVVAPPR